MYKIPFFKTTLGDEEVEAVKRVIKSGWVVMGEKTEEFEQSFADYVGGYYAVFLDSGTSALDLCVKYLKKKRVFEEYPDCYAQSYATVPSLTFTSTAEVLHHNEVGIKFVDVDKDTFCAKADVAVHLLGNQAPFGAMMYDSAHRIEKEEKIMFDIPHCYSFYATKNMTTIQGGMVVTNNAEMVQWLRMARDHGLDLGTKERYTEKYKQYDIKFIGWREKSDDLHAAVGLEQLKKLPWMTQERNRIVGAYNALLGLKRTGNHVYPVLVEKRDEFMEFMHKKEIQCTIHFRPLHLMTGYERYRKEELPNTEYLGERIVSIPMFPGMKDEEVEYVANSIKESGLLIKE